MANAGKTIVKIKAPVMMVQTQKNIKEPVWMERNFFPNLLDLIKEYKIEKFQLELLTNPSLIELLRSYGGSTET